MKKIFNLNLTWKKLIISSLIISIYTGIMSILSFNTTFNDFGIWILFGIIIILNSKTPIESLLKNFVFYLISFILICLIQVPFNELGILTFISYRYLFLFVLVSLPISYIGYYIKNKNILSFIILIPIFSVLIYLGLNYLDLLIDSFPQYLVSFMSCLISVLVLIFTFDKIKLKLLSITSVIILVIVYSILNKGIINIKYEVIKPLDIELIGESYISKYEGTKEGKVELIGNELKLIGKKGGKYNFELKDSLGNEYFFEYYYENGKVVLNRINIWFE